MTAKYIPAGLVTILTQPVGLKIKVDGQYNVLNPYYFAWGIGETHHLEAPAQQTDAQGRVWQFSSWSNGGHGIAGYRGAATTRTLNGTAVHGDLHAT